jgi:hypothetical protein
VAPTTRVAWVPAARIEEITMRFWAADHENCLAAGSSRGRPGLAEGGEQGQDQG